MPPDGAIGDRLQWSDHFKPWAAPKVPATTGGGRGEGQEGASKREIRSGSLGMRPYLEKESFTVIKLSS